MQTQATPHVRHNFVYNVFDGGFYGFGLYAASYQTVLPLFLATLTDSPLLIGLVGSLHFLGWQLPQMLTVGHVSRLTRYKRFVLLMTLHERLPYFGLLLVALLIPQLSRELALGLAFAMILWQSFGAGVTATGWQSMVAKIMPNAIRGTFYGMQSALAQGMGALGAIIAGLLIERLDSPWDYAACFAVASVGMWLSFAFLAQTREPAHEVEIVQRPGLRDVLRAAKSILARDVNFRWFALVRILGQTALMAQGFFAIFAVQRFGIADELIAGVMTTIMLVSQALGNPVLGWLGDRFGHRYAVLIGVVAAVGSALSVWMATGVSSFYLAFALGGIANAALWTTVLAMTPEFGSLSERPYYIALSSTLVAPASLLAPVIGGWLAESVSYEATFALAAIGGALALLVVAVFLRDPVPRRRPAATAAVAGD